MKKQTKNLFAFGPNKSKAKPFLSYIELKRRSTGLCAHLFNKNGNAYSFLSKQIDLIAKGKKDSAWDDYPVEFSVLSSKKKALDCDAYGSYNKSDNNNDYVKLRLWWAYNLAVAISKE
jgi:hypothetical protein